MPVRNNPYICFLNNDDCGNGDSRSTQEVMGNLERQRVWKNIDREQGGLKNKTVSSVIIGMKDGAYKPLAVDDCR